MYVYVFLAPNKWGEKSEEYSDLEDCTDSAEMRCWMSDPDASALVYDLDRSSRHPIGEVRRKGWRAF